MSPVSTICFRHPLQDRICQIFSEFLLGVAALKLRAILYFHIYDTPCLRAPFEPEGLSPVFDCITAPLIKLKW